MVTPRLTVVGFDVYAVDVVAGLSDDWDSLPLCDGIIFYET